MVLWYCTSVFSAPRLSVYVWFKSHPGLFNTKTGFVLSFFSSAVNAISQFQFWYQKNTFCNRLLIHVLHSNGTITSGRVEMTHLQWQYKQGCFGLLCFAEEGTFFPQIVILTRKRFYRISWTDLFAKGIKNKTILHTSQCYYWVEMPLQRWQ